MLYSLTTFLAVLFIAFNLSAQHHGYWTKSSGSVPTSKKSAFNPVAFTMMQADLQILKKALLPAAKGYYFEAIQKGIEYEVPMPDGSFQRFKIVETDVMHPMLAAKYPMIKTYAGLGITDAHATIRLDISPAGLHGMILSPKGDVFIEPLTEQNPNQYIIYFKKDNHVEEESFNCELIKSNGELQKPLSANRSISGSLRTYRLAVAGTGEYTRFFGGTVADGLAGIVTTVNRVTGVYETEVDIRLELIPNNDLIVYTNSATDPYSNNGGSTLLNQNQTNLDNVIGNSNYDIGHVFTTGNGGVANLGSVCRNTRKAEGTSGRGNPTGDKFDIDYVAHEMGHQFDAEHTFNATSGSCSGSRTASSAYEPGSGVTILGYAGICGSNNILNNSIPWFHNRSFTQIVNYSTTGAGGNCGTLTTNTNNAPVINTISPIYSIPVNTPFTLTAAGSDPDGDAITYSWEQFDNGPAGNWNTPSGDAPIFMSLTPSVSGTRLFPTLNNVLNNTNTKGELKPSYARTLNFRLTLRDNKGGVTNNDNLVAITVVNTGTPFEITTGNSAGTVPGGTQQTLTWNVSSTNLAPINCANVTIAASLDGGQTFPFVIASNAPNTGSFLYNVPNISADSVRVRITGNGNIFYDINNANLTIAPNLAMQPTPYSADMFRSANTQSLRVYPNPAQSRIYTERNATQQDIAYVTDGAGRTVLTILLPAGQTRIEYTLPNTIKSGIYYLKTGNTNPVKLNIMR